MTKKERYGDRYDNYTSSFSGSDCVVSLVFPDARPVTIGTATTITYSIYRQLAHVRTLGRISSKGYARGGVTYAGTIIFTVVNESFVEDIRSRIEYIGKFKKLRPDELPPFDIIMTFGNEFGQSSHIVIYGASFTDETKTISVEDIFSENVLTFLARDIQHMKMDKDTWSHTRSGDYREADEALGKFQLDSLIATTEDKERRARLEEIARREAERWEEPVLTDPGTIDVDTGSGDETSNPTSPGTPGEGTHGVVKIRVYESQGSSRTKLSGATVWYSDMMGEKISITTDSDGWAKFTVPYDIEFKYSVSKSGYSSDSKKITVKKLDGTKEDNFVINKVVDSSYQDPDAKKMVAYTNYDGPDYYKLSTYANQTIESIWSRGNGPKMKITNIYGETLPNIPVVYSYVIHNYDDWPLWKAIGKLAWSNAKGDLTAEYSDSKGTVSMPIFAYGDLFDGAIIEIIAKPYYSADVNDGMAGQSVWKSWYFIKDNGGL